MEKKPKKITIHLQEEHNHDHDHPLELNSEPSEPVLEEDDDIVVHWNELEEVEQKGHLQQLHFEEEEVQEYYQSVKGGSEDEQVDEGCDDVQGCQECDCHVRSGGQLYEHVVECLAVFDP